MLIISSYHVSRSFSTGLWCSFVGYKMSARGDVLFSNNSKDLILIIFKYIFFYLSTSHLFRTYFKGITLEGNVFDAIVDWNKRQKIGT